MNERGLTIVLIVALIVIGSIMKARYGSISGGAIRGFRRHWHDAGPADDPEKQRLREEVQALKERVAVLERIATDSSSNLAQEIEQLRDR